MIRFQSILLTLALLLTLCGCAAQDVQSDTAPAEIMETTSEPTVQEPGQFLPISAEPDDGENAHANQVDKTYFHGVFNSDISYFYLKNVTISLDGQSLPLEEAIRDGKVMLPQLRAWAQMDAAKGFCREETFTDLGLTYWIYHYPDYDVRLVYDYYETPDGNAYLMEDLDLYAPGDCHMDELGMFIKEGGSPVDLIDKEDWGLTFQVTEVTPDGITIGTTQTGGQQVGSLTGYRYVIYSDDLPELSPIGADLEGVALTMDGTGEFSIDWTEAYGQLQPGTYTIRIYFEDHFDPETIHPLIVKYHKRQGYDITFTLGAE